MLDFLQFLYVQRIKGFTAPSAPHFDSDKSSRWFEQKLLTTTRYLEFGSGGSTFLAAKLNKPFVCVDSDRFFLRVVVQKITVDGYHKPISQSYLSRNIGLTREWGQPVVRGGLVKVDKLAFGATPIFRLSLFLKMGIPI